VATLNLALDPVAWDGSPIIISRTENGDLLIQGLSGGRAESIDETPDDAVTHVLDRWKKQDAQSGAFALVNALRERGLAVVAPTVRKEGKSVEPYLRLRTQSRTGVTVTAYINTDSFSVHAQKLRPLVAAVPGADVRSNGSVYFDVSDTATCLAAVDVLLDL